MAARTGLSKSTIGRIWRRFELMRHVQDSFKLSTKLSSDPQFVDKVVDVDGLYPTHHQHWAVEFRKILIAIGKAVPTDLDVHLICDNLATHKTPAIRDWLACHPRFHLHFTPSGSSWINQVERWFGLLTDQLIRRGVHQSVVALENDVRQWIKKWNEGPNRSSTHLGASS